MNDQSAVLGVICPVTSAPGVCVQFEDLHTAERDVGGGGATAATFLHAAHHHDLLLPRLRRYETAGVPAAALSHVWPGGPRVGVGVQEVGLAEGVHIPGPTSS